MDPLTIVIGLGNPGEHYRTTRHNVGFWVLDRLARRAAVTFRTEGELRRYAWLAQCRLAGQPVLLAKPRTYMNRSGRAAAALCRAFEIEPRELTVVFDDADLELGRIRVRRGGGAGGHNGVRSMIEVLGEDGFTRVRLGVRGEDRGETELADYVLSEFTDAERPVAEALADLAGDAVESLLLEGLEQTMNRYNGVKIAGANSES